MILEYSSEECKLMIPKRLVPMWDLYTAKMTPRIDGNKVMWPASVLADFCRIHKVHYWDDD